MAFNPRSPERFFSKHIFRRRFVATPLRIINTEGHVTLNLLPVYMYNGRILSIDTKKGTNHLFMTTLCCHNVACPRKLRNCNYVCKI